MNQVEIFCKSCYHFVLFDHSLGFLELYVEILKVYVFPVVQLYVEMFGLVNLFGFHLTLI